ncbi:MAG TPA: ABC transporter substrate-binding protein [Burkholderiaceae bacterium]|jgi:ABC-type branched-subunit amino acid transport system substrate-binding protein
MHKHPTRRNALVALGAAAASLALDPSAVRAQGKKAYGPGTSDTEIVIGQTMPYSGPLAALSVIGKVHEGYFQMINERGGINGRKVRLISLDDGYSPPRTLEQTRRMVEQDNAALIFAVMGTPTNTVIQKYLNAKKVPQLFISGAGSRFFDPKNSPWTISAATSLFYEARLHAKYLLQEKPDAKIAVLYQNDDYGKDYLAGLNAGLGDKAAKMIVGTASYEVTDPTVDSQIITLKTSGADTLLYYCATKASSQAIRKTAEIGWKPLRILANGSRSISQTLVPAGIENSIGVVSVNRWRDLDDPEVAKAPEMQAYFAFMKKYAPSAHPTEGPETYAYLAALLLTETLKNCGDDLTRENIMKQATNLKSVPIALLPPGVTVSTSPTDYEITKKMQFGRFDGKHWAPFGQPVGL